MFFLLSPSTSSPSPGIPLLMVTKKSCVKAAARVRFYFAFFARFELFFLLTLVLTVAFRNKKHLSKRSCSHLPEILLIVLTLRLTHFFLVCRSGGCARQGCRVIWRRQIRLRQRSWRALWLMEVSDVYCSVIRRHYDVVQRDMAS